MDFLLGNKYLAIIKWVAIAGAVWYIFHTWDKAQGYDAVKAQLDQTIADHNAYIATRAAQDSITAKVSTDYENAITDLMGQLNTARDANGHVRVCHSVPQASPTSTIPSRPDAASQDRPAPEAEQVVSTSELYEIAGEAVECGERLNHLQDWIRKQGAL